MSEQHQHHSSTPEMQAQLSLDQVFDQAYMLKKRAAIAHSHIQAAMAPEAWEKIEDLPPDQQIETAHEYLTTTAPDSLTDVELHLASYKNIIQEQQTLETQESARAHAEAQRVTHDLLTTTDWDKVATELMNPFEDQNIPYKDVVVCMRALTTRNQPEDLLETARVIGDIDHLRTIFDTAGLRLAEPSPEPEWHIEGDLPQAIKDWIDLANESSGYLSSKRREWFDQHAPTPQLAALLVSLKNMQADQSPLPTQVTEAFEHVAGEAISTFLSEEKNYITAELESRPNSLFIQNITEAAKVYGLQVDEISAIINDAFDEIPEHFSSGLGFIEFIHKVEPSAKKWQGGEMISKENKIQIELGDYVIEKNGYEALGATPDDAHRYALKRFKRTFKHELGHYIHSNVLSLEDLITWQEALNTEPKHITSYVNKLADNGEKAGRINNEQFSESWEGFINDPDLLEQHFPHRYAAFKSIVQKYQTPGLSSSHTA